jgi:hypothetical protein
VLTNERSLDIPADYFSSEESREYVGRQWQRLCGELDAAEQNAKILREQIAAHEPVKRYYVDAGKLAGVTESAEGEFVRYADIKHLLQVEPTREPMATSSERVSDERLTQIKRSFIMALDKGDPNYIVDLEWNEGVSILNELTFKRAMYKGSWDATLYEWNRLAGSEAKPAAKCVLCGMMPDEVAARGCFYDYDKERGCAQAIKGAVNRQEPFSGSIFGGGPPPGSYYSWQGRFTSWNGDLRPQPVDASRAEEMKRWVLRRPDGKYYAEDGWGRAFWVSDPTPFICTRASAESHNRQEIAEGCALEEFPLNREVKHE